MTGNEQTHEERECAHCQHMLDQGFRLIEMWVPDVTGPEFAAEARRQAMAVAASEAEHREIARLESLVDELPWYAAMEWDDDTSPAR